jgi:carboxyl-terminal processing protease
MNISRENACKDISMNSQHGPEKAANGRNVLFFRRLMPIILLILLLPISSVAENLTCCRLPILLEKFLVNHYTMKSMTGELKKNAADQMIKSLDPSKTLLYESDQKSLRLILQNVFTSMNTGDCASLQQVYDLLVSRARENEAIVKKILWPDYRLDDTVELTIDVNKRPYVKTKEEKQKLLRKVVQFQIENALLSGVDLKEAIKQQIHRYELQTKRVAENNSEKLVTTAAEAFAQALDPHTSYLSPENFEDLRIQMQLSLEGIGAALSSDNGFTVIEELIPGGAAERSGLLKPKDKIIAVAQEGAKSVDTIDMDLHDVIKMIRGRKGTPVTLTILRQDVQTKRFNATIMRERIDIKEQEARITYETRNTGGRNYYFGVIDLPSFYGDEKESKSCYEDVKKLLAEAQRQNVDGIVLDLSRNGGGLLKEAVRLAGLFIGDGAIVATRDNRGQVVILANGPVSSMTENGKRTVVELPSEDPPALYKGPLVVLTSRLSASASEIVAGALKDYNRAVIVGQDHTFGKGSVQVLTPLPGDLGAMTITSALYFLPGGKSTQKTGVEADVRLPIWLVLESIGETTLDYSLPAEMIKPFLDVRKDATPLWKPVAKTELAEIARQSGIRIAKNEKFKDIIKDNKEAVARRGVIRFADLRKEMEKENGGMKKETNAGLKKQAREQYAPFVSESVNVLLNIVMLRSGLSIQ